MSNNATISIPGPDWFMRWTPGFSEFQLDIVGFLAILGENSVTANAQVAALSRLFYLPRLIPAPQALLWTTRRAALEPTVRAFVTAVESGNYKDHIHHVASVLLSKADEMPNYTVRCIKISKRDETSTRIPSWTDRAFRGQPDHDEAKKELEKGTMDKPSVKAKALGPLALVTLLGSALSIALLILSVALGDGMSMLATILLSLLSTLVGISNKWTLQLAKRAMTEAPAGDVVIRYIRGSILVIKCEEHIARELFFAPEEINYNIKKPWIYRLIALVGTLMLMLGVIFLANARLQLQFAWAAAYIIINAAHWVAAAIPADQHWDFSCYQIEEQAIDGCNEKPTFTDALWKAIQVSKSTKWCRLGTPAAPETETWDKWLEGAKAEAAKAETQYAPIKERSLLWDNSDKNIVDVWTMEKEWDAKGAWNRIHGEMKAKKA